MAGRPGSAGRGNTPDRDDGLTNTLATLHKGGKGDLEMLNSLNGVTGLANKLGVDLSRGLSSRDVPARQSQFGRNRIPERRARWYVQHVFAAFQDKTILLLFICMTAQLIISMTMPSEQELPWLESATVLFMVVIIASIRGLILCFQEHAMRRQKYDVSMVFFNVLRDGTARKVPMHSIVVGDVVLFQAGERLEADGVFIPGCSEVLMDESQLTGVAYDSKKSADDAPFLFSGTNVKSGSGRYLVTAVGTNSVCGRVIARLRGLRSTGDSSMDDAEADLGKGIVEADNGQLDSVLQKKLETLVTMVAVFALGSAGVATFVCLGRLVCGEYLIQGREFDIEADLHRLIQALVMGIAVVIVALPKGLLNAASLALVVSMRRLRKKGAMVKCLKATGTMARATALCIHKRGVMANSRLHVAAAYFGHTQHKVLCLDGAQDDKSNTCARQFRSAMTEGRIHRDVQAMIIDNISVTKDENASISVDKGKLEHEGNKIDCALMQFLADAGCNANLAGQELKSYPFSPSRRRSGKAIVLPSGVCRLYVKGAGEDIINLCAYHCLPDGYQIQLGADHRAGILADMAKFGTLSMTPIALAYRDFDSPPNWDEEVGGYRAAYLQSGGDGHVYQAETSLTLLGILGIRNHLCPGVEDTVFECSKAGLDLRMVSGDHKETAMAIAKDAGVLRKGIDYDEKGCKHPFTVMTSDEFRRRVLRKGDLNQAAFDEVWPVLRLVARSTPEDRRTLTQGLMNSRLFKTEAGKNMNVYPGKQVVAVTGNDTNDARVLHSADVGFGSGTGTQVAQDAADVLLQEEGLSTVVDVCRWGRNVHDSIAKLIQFQLTVNIAAVTITVVGAVMEGSMPISVVQMLWVSLLMDTLGATAFANEMPQRQEQLRCTSHAHRNGLVSYEMFCNFLCQSAFQLIVLLVVLFLGAGSWCSQEEPPECWQKGGFFDIASGLGQGPYSPPTQHFTMIFNAFVCMQLCNWINCRQLHHELNVFRGLHRNMPFIFLWLVYTAIQVVIVQLPSFIGGAAGEYISQALQTTPLDLNQWIFCIGSGISSLILQVVISVVGRRLKPRLTRGESYKPGIRLEALPTPSSAVPKSSNGRTDQAFMSKDRSLNSSQVPEEEQPLLQERERKALLQDAPPVSDIQYRGEPLYEKQVPAPVIQWLPPGQKVLTGYGDIVKVVMGRYFLEANDGCAVGQYTFDPETRQLRDLEGIHKDELIGTFMCEPISATPLPFLLGPEPGTRSFPCISIRDSEIMAQIQMLANQDAYFVLPSQLNGAEYPSHDSIVDFIEKYKTDDTGGPRGQLAVHPAVGQFLLDNAGSDLNPQGINALDGILEALWSEGLDFGCKNGYMEVPHLEDQRSQERALMVIRKHLHKLRILTMEGVHACGLSPDKTSLSKANHTVNLIYSSAVPVQAYLNAGVNTEQQSFQQRVADEVLVAQYYGALHVAAQGVRNQRRVKVFLMPLGGGVFNNSWHSIARSMSQAVEMLSWEEHERLDVHVLTWSGNPKESEIMTELLLQHGKLKELSSMQPPDSTDSPGATSPQKVHTPPLAEKHQATSLRPLESSPEAFGNFPATHLAVQQILVDLPEERMANYRLQWSFEENPVQPLGLEIKWGDTQTMPRVGDLKPEKQAARRGLEKGDILVEVNSIPTSGLQKEELLPILQLRPLLLQVERPKVETNVRWAYLELKVTINAGPSKQTGMDIDDSSNSILVIWVWPGTPAYAAGVMPGDALVKINGQAVSSMPMQMARLMLQAEHLSLTLHRRPVSDHPVPEFHRRANAAASKDDER